MALCEEDDTAEQWIRGHCNRSMKSTIFEPFVKNSTSPEKRAFQQHIFVRSIACRDLESLKSIWNSRDATMQKGPIWAVDFDMFAKANVRLETASRHPADRAFATKMVAAI